MVIELNDNEIETLYNTLESLFDSIDNDNQDTINEFLNILEVQVRRINAHRLGEQFIDPFMDMGNDQGQAGMF